MNESDVGKVCFRKVFFWDRGQTFELWRKGRIVRCDDVRATVSYDDATLGMEDVQVSDVVVVGKGTQ